MVSGKQITQDVASMSAIVPTNSLLIGHESHLLCCRWVMKHIIHRQPGETVLEERSSFSHPGSTTSCVFLSILPQSCVLSSKKFLNIVVSPENVSVFTHIPREQAMNGNVYNEKCKAWGEFSHELY